jgi:hypothetical protein
MIDRRSFIRGPVRVAPIVVVPGPALEALGRSMVGWTRALEPIEDWHKDIKLVKRFGGIEYAQPLVDELGLQAELEAEGYELLESDCFPGAIVWRKP